MLNIDNNSAQLRNIALVCLSGVVLLLALWFGSMESDDLDSSGQGANTETSDGTIGGSAPTFDIVRISRGGTGVLAGRAAPGVKVQVIADGVVVAEVTADSNGEWVAILDKPLPPGSAELNLVARAVDDQSIESVDVLVVSVPQRDPDKFIESDTNGVVAIKSPRDGSGASTIMQKPGGRVFAEVGESLAIDSIDYGNSVDGVISGRALPRVKIWLYLDGALMTRTEADDEGIWRTSFDSSLLTPGSHTLRADQVITEGNVKLRVEQPFQLGEPLDPSLAENGVIVQPGNSLWAIARQLYGDGVRYTVIFRENNEQIADPDLIYPGQVFKVPAGQQGPSS